MVPAITPSSVNGASSVAARVSTAAPQGATCDRDGIVRPVHLSHAAPVELRDDLVLTQSGPGFGGQAVGF